MIIINQNSTTKVYILLTIMMVIIYFILFLKYLLPYTCVLHTVVKASDTGESLTDRIHIQSMPISRSETYARLCSHDGLCSSALHGCVSDAILSEAPSGQKGGYRVVSQLVKTFKNAVTRCVRDVTNEIRVTRRCRRGGCQRSISTGPYTSLQNLPVRNMQQDSNDDTDVVNSERNGKNVYNNNYDKLNQVNDYDFDSTVHTSRSLPYWINQSKSSTKIEPRTKLTINPFMREFQDLAQTTWDDVGKGLRYHRSDQKSKKGVEVMGDGCGCSNVKPGTPEYAKCSSKRC